MNNLQATENPYFYPIGNGLLFWDVLWAWRLERWKKKNAEKVMPWFEVIFEFEALNSFAAVAYLHSDWPFPIIQEGSFVLKGSHIGHPLIPESKRVENDVAMVGTGKCLVITGSNMSGKSTFLRTLGINAVMALSGMTVCAKNFEISLLRIHTSMRTQDSLEESTSSFYAELKRIKSILDALSGELPVFYLLDEILKGTNSRDRHRGAMAIIQTLITSNASGLISTHDLELGNEAERNPGKVENYSFNSYIREGKLYFDYKLTDGVCKSFNASELMRQIGIELPEETEHMS